MDRHGPPEPVLVTEPEASTAPATDRPAGAYTLGAVGGGMFGVGGFAFAFSVLKQGSAAGSLEEVALFGMAGGGLLLGIAWVLITRGGLFKGQHGGFAAIAGSLAVPLSMLFAYVNRKDFGALQTAAMLVVLSTAFFAFGHAIVRGAGLTRVVARVALVPILVEVLRTLGLFTVSFDSALLLGMLTSAGLGAIGFAAMIDLPRMAKAPPPGDPDLRL